MTEPPAFGASLKPTRIIAHDVRAVFPFVFALVLFLAGCGDCPEPIPEPTGTFGQLTTQNTDGRSGAYYLPAGYAGEALPVMLLYHGTNGVGLLMANAFAGLADESRFIIVAPDSRQSPNGDFSWEVGVDGSVTEDFLHTARALNEVEALPNVNLAWGNAFAGGHSGGASSAAYFATNDGRFSAFAVLHGGIVPGSIGENVIKGFFATGEEDTFRSPDHVQGHVDYMRQVEEFGDITYTVYPGGHAISTQEARDIITWWLGN